MENNSAYNDLPTISELQPSHQLLNVFEDCHNHIFANEGLLKERIFKEFVKLLLMKLMEEKKPPHSKTLFGITKKEYELTLEGKESEFIPRMQSLFEKAKLEFSTLFPNENGLTLLPATLAYVVNKLQWISFADTNRDIKGEAFQTFINRHQRGDRGEFFTPHPVVKLCVKMMNPKDDETICDPACGSGGFLIQSIAHVTNGLNVVEEAFDLSKYISNNIRGIDFNPDIAQAAMIRLLFEGGTGEEITCANSLTNMEEYENRFDYVLTNPPFGSKGKISNPAILQSYDLGKEWDDSFSVKDELKKGQTPEILFIERCIKLLKPGGQMAIVLPDGILQSSSSKYIRHWLRNNADIYGVISLPQETFIPYGTGIKTSVLFTQKKPAEARKHCFMSIIKNIGYDVKGQPIFLRDNKGLVLNNDFGKPIIKDDVDKISSAFNGFQSKNELVNSNDEIFSVPYSEMNSRFDVEHYLPSDRLVISKLQSSGAKPISEIADIVRSSKGFNRNNVDAIRYISISDIDSRTMQVINQQRLEKHDIPSRAKYKVKTGDIITALAGASTGTSKHATAIITEEENGAICSNGFAVIRNVKEVDPLFLLYFMGTSLFHRQVRRLLTGHAIPAVSIEDFGSVLVPILPKTNEEEIVNKIKIAMSLKRELLNASRGAVESIKQEFDKL